MYQWLQRLILSLVFLSFCHLVAGQSDTTKGRSINKNNTRSIIKEDETKALVVKFGFLRFFRGELPFMVEIPFRNKWSFEIAPSLTYYDMASELILEKLIFGGTNLIGYYDRPIMDFSSAKFGMGQTAQLKYFFDLESSLNGQALGLYYNHRLHKYDMTMNRSENDIGKVNTNEIALTYSYQSTFPDFKEIMLGVGVIHYSMDYIKTVGPKFNTYEVKSTAKYFLPRLYVNWKFGLDVLRR